MNYILRHVDEVPRKIFKRSSKVNQVLRELYDGVKLGHAAQFDPKAAGVNPESLRMKLLTMVKAGVYPKGTKILSRGKDWYFKKG